MKFYIAPVYQIEGPTKPLNFVSGKTTVDEEKFRQTLKSSLTDIGCTGKKLEELKPKLTEAVFRKGVQVQDKRFSISGKGEFKPFE